MFKKHINCDQLEDYPPHTLPLPLLWNTALRQEPSPLMATKRKKMYNFHVRATLNISAYLINYFLKCLFHFGSWSLEYYNYHFWEKKYTSLYFCFCSRSSCSSGWKVNTSLCSAAAHILVVPWCPLGDHYGPAFMLWVHKEHKDAIDMWGQLRGLPQVPVWLGSVCWSWKNSPERVEKPQRKSHDTEVAVSRDRDHPVSV